MTKELPLQLSFVERVEVETLTWAKTEGIRLHRIEVVVPFVLTDKSLWVWLFFDTDILVNEYRQNGLEEQVKQHYLDTLKNLNYPADYLAEVKFFIDSDENVVKNFEGSYFYRLR